MPCQCDFSLTWSYRNLPNIKTLITDSTEKDIYVFFSSNGLYYPNHPQQIRRTVSEDYYEFSKFENSMSGRVIFVRDILKQWYAAGISDEINDLEKLGRKLSEILRGRPCVLVGVSAGGYAALKVAKFLNVKRVYAFSPQFSLEREACRFDINPVLMCKYSSELDIHSTDITVPTIYVCPIGSREDRLQLNYAHALSSKNLIILRVKSKKHGLVIPKQMLHYILNADTRFLCSLSSRAYSVLSICLRLIANRLL